MSRNREQKELDAMQKDLDVRIARREAEAVARLRRACESILAAIERGDYETYYDICTGRVRVTAAGYERWC